ncbi:hypothetical protein [Zobellia uliginosa]|uniref:hypothetical protein n=1 Tax=Zobellia uliginosa TaxID=143224 RepID=UPI0026E468BE|nr:hypothetical protein [Zobellia uliginosa]MDO6517788.1 hypothetical protein [Zobellia uliginosa]
MQNNIVLIVIFALATILFGCDGDEGAAINISNNVLISVLNAKGEDLLDPEHPSAIDLSQIKVYYELNGVKTEINRPNLDFPQEYRLEEPNSNLDYYRIYLFLNTEDSSNPTVTYFEWNPEEVDVFESTLIRSGGSIHNDKIWLNDELVCDGGGDCELTKIMD